MMAVIFSCTLIQEVSKFFGRMFSLVLHGFSLFPVEICFLSCVGMMYMFFITKQLRVVADVMLEMCKMSSC